MTILRDAEEREPTHLSEVLRLLLAKVAPTVGGFMNERAAGSTKGGVGRGAHRVGERLEQVQAMWQGAIGPGLAEATRVVRYREGILTVDVASTPLLAELRGFQSNALLDALSRGGLSGVHTLRFRCSGSGQKSPGK